MIAIKVQIINTVNINKREQNQEILDQEQNLLSIKQLKMTTPSTMLNQPTSQLNSSLAQFASIQINDALIKFSLYLQKLINYEQSHMRENQPKCQKLVRLMLQAFIKYAQTQEFAKQSYEMVKSCIMIKKSYYSLIMMDLMLKNNKYIIKQVKFYYSTKVKKQLQPIMKLIWQKVSTETYHEIKQQRVQNLKVIIKCWGFIFGEKLQETLRKWLQAKYNIKRIELTEENEKALRQTYGEKIGKEGGKTTTERQSKLSEALLNSLIDDDHQVGDTIYNTNSNLYNTVLGSTTHNTTYHQSRQSINHLDPRMYRYQTSIGQISIKNNSDQQLKSSTSNEPTRPSLTANLPNNYSSQHQTTKPKLLEGVNKSLLEALDLN